MKEVLREITEEEVKKAEKDGVRSLFSTWELWGYGIYSPRIFEKDGKHFLTYEMGDSCE